MRHVFSMDMDRDADLCAIAETAATCELKLESGSCRKGMCRTCETAHELELCVNALPACDSLRVKSLAQGFYQRKRFQYGLNEPKVGSPAWRREWKEALPTLVWTLAELLLIAAGSIGFLFGLMWLCMR